MKNNIKKQEIINFICTWGYNPGDVYEIMVLLAESNGIEDIKARVLYDEIAYDVWLNETGVEIYEKWCSENEHSIHYDDERTKYFEFIDMDKDSVENTIVELGLEKEDTIEVREKLKKKFLETF